MTTAVASPPNFQPLPRLSWNGASTSSGGFSAMSTDDVSRIFMPQRKVMQRSGSSSSLSSASSASSTITLTQSDASAGSSPSSDPSPAAKKKARGGFWPVSKSESTSSVTNARANGSVQTAGLNAAATRNQVQPGLSTPNSAAQVNGSRVVNGQAPTEPAAILALLPMNGTFERKQINVPFYPDVLRVGRQTNAKTVPTPVNGYFDSKVLSRQHAEVWADRSGKIWIRDVKSSNGTFVNGQRLSPENRESEPHELRQHDTLELGIDIVSEDQKTIVHHKVSAKVEYAGLPGATNNVLDLNFGDLDPSHGGSLLSSPISAPMMHSRSRLGAPATNGRASTASSVAGSQTGSAAQQRQLNFWGAPLNVEQLVKSLSTEMRAARQQAEELDQAGAFLNAVLTTDGNPSKLQPPFKEGNPTQSRQLNGRSRASKFDHAARFADPPAPPPQQPLPEKPDSAKSSPINSMSFTNLLKRSEIAKPTINNPSPVNPQNSQMLSLIEALSIAKKELDSQGARVRQLEEMLKQERTAREDAEERARRLLEQHAAGRPASAVEEVTEVPPTELASADKALESHLDDSESPATEQNLQQRLDQMVSEMQRMKSDMDKFQHRAQTAEADATNARTSLAEMINKLREENSRIDTSASPTKRSRPTDNTDRAETGGNIEGESSSKISPERLHQANGHVRTPKLPHHLERAVATVLQDRGNNSEVLAQSAPYVSMLGVVLIGVGLMAYLNSWQKTER